jgi:uncharacterized glyoxalase superfamily protein PhnB/uncharacterized protein YndB with AHSA1/START domain
MTELDAVTATVDVAVDPATAFEVFTAEIDSWWKPGPTTWNDSTRAVGMRFEPGVGGRWLEIWNEETGEGFEMGRITLWDPPSRLVFAYRDNDLLDPVTEVDVRFEPIPAGTRVTLEHRGFDRVAGDVGTRKRRIKEYAWPACLTSFATWTVEREGTGRRGLESLPRILPVLSYADVGRAADWLCSAFGFRERMRYPDRDGQIVHAELDLAGAVVLLRRLPDEVPSVDRSTDQGRSLYVYVDDLEAHLAQAMRSGAEILSEPRHFGDLVYTARDVEGHEWTFAQAHPTMRSRRVAISSAAS